MDMNLSKLQERKWRTEEPGMLQPMGLQRVGHDLATQQQQQGWCNQKDFCIFLWWDMTCSIGHLVCANTFAFLKNKTVKYSTVGYQVNVTHLPICTTSICWALVSGWGLLGGVHTDECVQFIRSVMFDSLQPQGLQHVGPPCPSATPGAYSNSCPLSWWCHPTFSPDGF